MRLAVAATIALFAAVPAFAQTPPQTQGGAGGTFVSPDIFAKAKPEEQSIYATGMADAFLYLEARNGFMRGLGKCLATNQVGSTAIAKIINDVFTSTPGPDKPSVPQAFEIASRSACGPTITDAPPTPTAKAPAKPKPAPKG